MFSTLAMLAIASNPIVPATELEQPIENAFDKTAIISAISEQIRLEVESISTETFTELTKQTFAAEHRIQADTVIKPVETIGDE